MINKYNCILHKLKEYCYKCYLCNKEKECRNSVLYTISFNKKSRKFCMECWTSEHGQAKLQLLDDLLSP